MTQAKSWQLISCDRCNSKFFQRACRQRFCCRRCQVASYHKRLPPTRICPTCNTEFTKKGAAQVYCSNKCKFKAHRITEKRNNPERVKKSNRRWAQKRDAIYRAAILRFPELKELFK